MKNGKDTIYHILESYEAKGFDVQILVHIASKHYVYELTDEDNSKYLILKIYEADALRTESIHSFLELRHPNIMPLKSIVKKQNHVLFEYDKYITFQDYIKDHNFYVSDLYDLAAQILSGLSFFHENNILHGDIDLSNIYYHEETQLFILGDYSNCSLITREQEQEKDYRQLLQVLIQIIQVNNPSMFFTFSTAAIHTQNDVLDFLKNHLDIDNNDFLLLTKTDRQHPCFFPKTQTHRIEKCTSNQLMIFPILLGFLLSVCFSFFFISRYIFHTQEGTQMTKKTLAESGLQNNASSTICETPKATVTVSSHETVIVPQQTVNSQANCSLDFSNKSLASVTEGLNSITYSVSLSQITSLYLENNLLTDLEEISSFPSLLTLVASNNTIEEISPISQNKTIETLILSDNNLLDLSPLSDLNQLKYLDLSGNTNMKNITKLSKLKNLECINLSDTNVTKLELQFLQDKLSKTKILSNVDYKP